MLINEIATVAVVVSDAKRSKEWFRDKLGFEVKDDVDHWVVVAPRGSTTAYTCVRPRSLNLAIRGYFSTLTMSIRRVRK